MIVHGKVSVLVTFDRLTQNHVDTRPKKGLKWYRMQLNTNVTPCERQHLFGWFKGHTNMIVHGKVSILVNFETLTPNHVVTGPKKGLKWYRIH